MASSMREARPELSLQERDRRYALIREHLKERGVDCVIVSGTNLLYLTNGIPGEQNGLRSAHRKRPIERALLDGPRVAPGQDVRSQPDARRVLQHGQVTGPQIIAPPLAILMIFIRGRQTSTA